jgi:hypothetical protein
MQAKLVKQTCVDMQERIRDDRNDKFLGYLFYKRLALSHLQQPSLANPLARCVTLFKCSWQLHACQDYIYERQGSPVSQHGGRLRARGQRVIGMF